MLSPNKQECLFHIRHISDLRIYIPPLGGTTASIVSGSPHLRILSAPSLLLVLLLLLFLLLILLLLRLLLFRLRSGIAAGELRLRTDAALRNRAGALLVAVGVAAGRIGADVAGIKYARHAAAPPRNAEHGPRSTEHGTRDLEAGL